MSFTDVFGGSTVQPSEVRYRAIALTANISLFWPQQGIDTASVIARWNDVTPSGAGFSITFPSAETIGPGQDAVFTNKGSNAYDVLANDSTLIATVSPSTAMYIINSDNTTVAGAWQLTTFGGTASQVNAAALAGDGLIAQSGQLSPNFPLIPIASNYTSTVSDLANVLNWTGGAGTITLANAGTAGQGWFCEIRNSGGGSVVVSPPTGTIDGAASKTYATTESSLVHTDGVNYYTVGYGRSISSQFTRLVVSVAGNTDVTLTSSQAQNQMLEFTGALTGNINVNVPATVAQFYVYNHTTGAFTLTFKATGGTGAIVIQGQRRIAVCDGTNVNFADTLGTGTVTQVNTGTGLTGGPITATGTVALANTGVSAGSYTLLAATVDAQGRLTAASSGSLDIIGNVQGNMLYRNASVWTALAPGTAGAYLQSAGAAANLLWSPVTGRLIGPRVFSATATYTPTSAAVTRIVVWCLGGGGGAGAAIFTSASQVSWGSGGGGGGFCIGFFTAGFSGQTVTVGSGGTTSAGTGGAIGATGGTSAFLTCSAAGGAGGQASNAIGASFVATFSGSPGVGGLATSPTTGLVFRGGAGSAGWGFPTVGEAIGGGGGSPGFFGGSGNCTGPIASLGFAGNSGSSFGQGGSGGANSFSQTTKAGGTGASGLVVIWEYT